MRPEMTEEESMRPKVGAGQSAATVLCLLGACGRTMSAPLLLVLTHREVHVWQASQDSFMQRGDNRVAAANLNLSARRPVPLGRSERLHHACWQLDLPADQAHRGHVDVGPAVRVVVVLHQVLLRAQQRQHGQQ